jgi:hypothetical protein
VRHGLHGEQHGGGKGQETEADVELRRDMMLTHERQTRACEERDPENEQQYPGFSHL